MQQQRKKLLEEVESMMKHAVFLYLFTYCFVCFSIDAPSKKTCMSKDNMYLKRQFVSLKTEQWRIYRYCKIFGGEHTQYISDENLWLVLSSLRILQ